jgi:outer membrane protein OmpA-like peptidoglycan-associated protein
MTTTVHFLKTGLHLTVPLLLVLAGCGSSVDEMTAKDRLEQARAAYAQAKANPDVTGVAQLPLLDAEKELRAAEDPTNYEKMEHRAYLSLKKSQTALALAEGKAAEREQDQLKKESTEAILTAKEREMAARGRELKTAQTEAERAKSEAVSAKTAADVAKSEAEKSQSEAERARSEAVLARSEAEKSKAANEQLVKELSELKGKQTDRGIVVTIGDLLFETGKATLSTQANASIAKLSQFLLNHPTRNLSIEGHTDNVGSDDYNDALSQRRAEAVKHALVEKGVGTERIVTKGLGKRFPIASNATAQGRQLNRRVEVVVLNEGVAAETPAQAR